MKLTAIKAINRVFLLLLTGLVLTGCALKEQPLNSLEFSSDSYLLPLLTDFSSLPQKVVKGKKLIERKTQLIQAQLNYSYLLLEKSCLIEKEYQHTLNQLQKIIESRMDAGLGRRSEYLQSKANVLEATVTVAQCKSQLDVMQSYAKFLNTSLDTTKFKYKPLSEPLNFESISTEISTKNLEWPLMKLIHSINGRSDMDKALSAQVIVQTQLIISLEQQFQVGQISTEEFLSARKEANQMELKLHANRMSLMMGLAELKYLLANPVVAE